MLVPFKRRLCQMSRNLHSGSPWNPGLDQIPDATAAEVVKKQALILPNLTTRLYSESYLNARGLKRLPQVPCVENFSRARQFLKNFIKLKRQGQQNRFLIFGLVPFDAKLESSLFILYLRPRDGQPAPTLQPVKYRNVTSGRRCSGMTFRSLVNCVGVKNPLRTLSSFSIGK
jgi:hypothetical protein